MAALWTDKALSLSHVGGCINVASESQSLPPPLQPIPTSASVSSAHLPFCATRVHHWLVVAL